MTTWTPPDAVPGHAWTATLGGTSLSLTVEADEGRISIDVPGDVTAPLDAATDWFLLADGEPVLHSRWTPSSLPGAGQDVDWMVAVRDLAVEVQVAMLAVALPGVIDGGAPGNAGDDVIDGGGP